MFAIKDEKFDGPLDLMLHLIREHKLDIFDLDLNKLTDQYIDYINKLEELHLEIEAEYLVELAILIEYKSRKLLPKKNEEVEGEYEEDPKEILMKRLLEFQRFKNIATEFDQLYKLRQQSFSREVILNEDLTRHSDNKINANPYDLYKAMNNLLKRMELSKPLEVRNAIKELSIDDIKIQLKEKMLNFTSSFKLETLLLFNDKAHFVCSFLAVLEMIYRQELLFEINPNNDEVYLMKGSINGRD